MREEDGLPPSWVVVTAVKRPDAAKSRLALPGEVRRRLETAMAMDTLAAFLACTPVTEVVVVTSDQGIAAESAAAGAHPVLEGRDSGLNDALIAGVDVARRLGRRAVALATADLPALRAAEVAAALREAAGLGQAYVSDAEGTGTTMLCASARSPARPRFGHGSAAAHATAGARHLGSADAGLLPGLRRDVDTVEQLREASVLGVGPRTAAVLASLRVPLAG